MNTTQVDERELYQHTKIITEEKHFNNKHRLSIIIALTTSRGNEKYFENFHALVTSDEKNFCDVEDGTLKGVI